jgi:hypothetical protein
MPKPSINLKDFKDALSYYPPSRRSSKEELSPHPPHGKGDGSPDQESRGRKKSPVRTVKESSAPIKPDIRRPSFPIPGSTDLNPPAIHASPRSPSPLKYHVDSSLSNTSDGRNSAASEKRSQWFYTRIVAVDEDLHIIKWVLDQDLLSCIGDNNEHLVSFKLSELRWHRNGLYGIEFGLDIAPENIINLSSENIVSGSGETTSKSSIKRTSPQQKSSTTPPAIVIQFPDAPGVQVGLDNKELLIGNKQFHKSSFKPCFSLFCEDLDEIDSWWR